MKRVLIVDDIKFIRYTLRRILEVANYDVVAEAEEGNKAIELYKKYSPDLVLLDMEMPGMNGADALKEIMKINPLANVIIVSATCTGEIVLDVMQSGAKGVIVKPFDDEKIIETINNLFLNKD